MRRPLILVLAAASLAPALSLIACAPAYVSGGTTRTYLGFMVGIGDAPPPPVLRFRGDLHIDPVEGSEVRVVEAPDPDCDLFLYRDTYFLFSGGYWYRARSVDGPFHAIEVHRVPRAVLNVPEGQWRHHPHRDADDRGDRDDRDHDRDR